MERFQKTSYGTTYVKLVSTNVTILFQMKESSHLKKT